MANLKISQLTAAGALTGTELVEAVQGGVNVQTTTQDIADLGGGGGAVDSVNGQTGVVVLDAGDIANTPSGNVSASTVQAAINELDGEIDSRIAAAIAGIKWKTSVRAATTVAGTLASDFENGDSVDGVTLATGNRILLKNQADQTQNGIYTVNASGAPTRSTDADAAAELESAAVTVDEGTSNANTTWLQITDSITLGVSNIVWTQYGSSVPDADETTKGIVERATEAETITGTDTTRFVSPATLQAKINEESLGFNPADELTEIAGLTLEDNILAADLLAALSIPGCIPIHSDAAVGVTLTNMGNALAVLPLGSTFVYLRYNTTNVRRMRLNARIVTVSASANNPRMYIQYSLLGSTWVTLGAGTIASGDAISMFTGATAVQYTNWITLPSEARGDSFFWRVVTEGGDGAADPVLGHIFIEYTT